MQNEENKIIMEYFDLKDHETLDVVTSVNEADKGQLLQSLASKLYDNIVNKIDEIDFGTIPASKGDITAVENYQQLCDCLNIMTQLITEYKQDPAPIKTVLDAIDNIKDRKALFMKAYTYNVELPIVMYNTMVLSCISSVSFLIASCVEYIKNNDSNTYKIALDKIAYRRSKDGLLIKNLSKFNKMCDNKSLDKCMNELMDANKKNLLGGLAAAAIVIMTIPLVIKVVIPLLRECVYFLFNTKQKISDFLGVQADLLQVNANSLQYKDIDDDKRETIYAKQMGVVDKLRNYSNKFDITRKKSENDTMREIESEQRKFKVSDITDTLPDSAEVSTSLF